MGVWGCKQWSLLVIFWRQEKMESKETKKKKNYLSLASERVESICWKGQRVWSLERVPGRRYQCELYLTRMSLLTWMGPDALSCLCVLRRGKERKELLKKIGKWQELLTWLENRPKDTRSHLQCSRVTCRLPFTSRAGWFFHSLLHSYED